MKILITGCAGFIGYHFAKKMIENGNSVYGIDNMNNYYDVKLKKFRLKELFKISKNSTGNFTFYKKDIRDSGFVKKCFKNHQLSNTRTLMTTTFCPPSPKKLPCIGL